MSTEPTSLVEPPRRSLRSLVPILRWLPNYGWSRDLPADGVAGIALAALLIPESMGYASVAGVPTEVGLYAALAAVVAYAVTGGTSILVVGPASAVAALSASVVSEFTGDIDPVVLTAGLAITSGVLLAVAGALRLGWIVNFISRPVLEAFVAGLSMSIVIGQLDGLLGVEVDGESAVARLIDLMRHAADWEGLTALVGLGSITVLLLMEHYVEKIPAAVIVVAGGILVAVSFDLAAEGVAVVGEVPQGLPGVGVRELSGTRWLELLAGGTALFLVGFSEGYASASAVADHTGEDIDPDQELLGAGVANLASGFVGGLAVGGSLSKSAASRNAGARTQMANLVAGTIVLATLLFLAPVFEDLPETVLAAIVIVAVLPSANPRRLRTQWEVNRLDFAAGIVTFVLVLVWETLPAMIVGVLLSLLFVVRRASFPDVVELRPDATGVYRRLVDDATDDVGVAVLRFEAPLVYANAERLRRAALALLDRQGSATRLVLDAEMVSDLDTTGAETLAKLDDELARRGVVLHLARVHHRARGQIERSHLAMRLQGRIHATIGEAVGVAGRPPEGAQGP